MSGSNFSDASTRADESWISFCNGYVQATVDSLSVGDGVCIPNGVTRTDLVTAVERTISASIQLKSINSFEAVRLAMRQAFLCPR
ncbi:Rap1a/Tai family immunity protein [Roseibium sp.]|uniref:Rap1a/Tai family immunity protein n=1 Tax=Roseibium sp. TaxID=1936156 RepID=UPI003D9C03DE